MSSHYTLYNYLICSDVNVPTRIVELLLAVAYLLCVTAGKETTERDGSVVGRKMCGKDRYASISTVILIPKLS